MLSGCVFIGHKNCGEEIKEKLFKTIENLITNFNVNTFYVGCEGNFDYMVYAVLSELDKLYSIEIIIVLAYLDKSKEYCDIKKTLFPEVLEKTPFRFAISKRNLFMIEKSRYMVCYMNNTFTNTYTFVKKAFDKGLKVINLGNYDLTRLQAQK